MSDNKLTLDEKTIVREWVHEHNDGNYSGLRELWKMIETILEGREDQVTTLVRGELPELDNLSGREVLITLFGDGSGELAVKDAWNSWGPPQKLNPAD